MILGSLAGVLFAMSKPEELARQKLDALQAAGWSVQDYQALNLSAARRVAESRARKG